MHLASEKMDAPHFGEEQWHQLHSLRVTKVIPAQFDVQGVFGGLCYQDILFHSIVVYLQYEWFYVQEWRGL